MRTRSLVTVVALVMTISACGASSAHQAIPAAPARPDVNLVRATHQKCAELGKRVATYLTSGNTSGNPQMDQNYATERAKILGQPPGARTGLARADADDAIEGCDREESARAAASVKVLLPRALSDYFNGKVALAKTEFNEVVKQDPKQQYAWYNLGVIAQAAGSDKEASTDYLEAITIQPGFESALYNYGVMRFQMNDVATAIAYLSRAVIADPNDANAHWNLGLALAKSQSPADNQRSATELNKALKLNPSLLKSLGGASTTTAP